MHRILNSRNERQVQLPLFADETGTDDVQPHTMIADRPGSTEVSAHLVIALQSEGWYPASYRSTPEGGSTIVSSGYEILPDDDHNVILSYRVAAIELASSLDAADIQRKVASTYQDVLVGLG